MTSGAPATVWLLAVLFCACAGPDSASTVRVLDLVNDFPRAERRPADGTFSVTEHVFFGVQHAGIDAPSASRLIWTTRLPARGWLRAVVAVLPTGASDATVSFRVGISDDRLYEPLAQERVSASRTRASGWVPLSADLSPYAGRKWSVFYRPDSKSWRLVLSTDRVNGDGRAFWGSPRVESDLAAAREWRKRGS